MEITADAANVAQSMQDATEKFGLDNGIIPAPYECWLDMAGLQRLADGGQVPPAALDGLRSIVGNPYNSGWRLFAAHRPLVHRHPHFPDLHHRHGH